MKLFGLRGRHHRSARQGCERTQFRLDNLDGDGTQTAQDDEPARGLLA